MRAWLHNACVPADYTEERPKSTPEAVHAQGCGYYLVEAEQAAMSSTQGDITSPSQINQAVKALFSALGAPCSRQPWSDGDAVGSHPVFTLGEHYRSYDRGEMGYTENRYRGDHMSIPCYTEDGDVFVLDISFHKGETFIERVDFPEGPPQVRRALYDLLDSSETR